MYDTPKMDRYITPKMDSVESQNGNIKLEYYIGIWKRRWGEEIKVKYYCGENVYALSNKS